jgi:hypothetical protein
MQHTTPHLSGVITMSHINNLNGRLTAEGLLKFVSEKAADGVIDDADKLAIANFYAGTFDGSGWRVTPEASKLYSALDDVFDLPEVPVF